MLAPVARWGREGRKEEDLGWWVGRPTGGGLGVR